MVLPFTKRCAWLCAGGGFIDPNGALAKVSWGLDYGLVVLGDLRREEALEFVCWIRWQVRRGDILAGRRVSEGHEHSLEPVSVQMNAGNVQVGIVFLGGLGILLRTKDSLACL